MDQDDKPSKNKAQQPPSVKKAALAAVKDEDEAADKKRKKRKREAEADRAPAQELAGVAGVGVAVKKPAVRKLGGGLTIKDLVVGCGEVPGPGSVVKVLYEGRLKNGTVFDKCDKARSPFSFRLGLKQVIPGMERGVQGMRVGGQREIYIPAKLGYGNQATGPIPANSDLIFTVELVAAKGRSR